MAAKIGLYIGRFQPFHKGHLAVIQEMDSAPDIGKIIIGVGSAQESGNTHNPFKAKDRIQMIEAGIVSQKPRLIVAIPDTHNDATWVSVIEDMLSEISPQTTVIYTGNPWTAGLFQKLGYEIRTPQAHDLMTATQVRRLMSRSGDWQKMVPLGTVEVIRKIGGVKIIQEIFNRSNT